MELLTASLKFPGQPLDFGVHQRDDNERIRALLNRRYPGLWIDEHRRNFGRRDSNRRIAGRG
jgi:hypothetical protein